MNIAIIPARAGSKRIPNKNAMEFNGKPMIAWTIQAALESKLFDLVFVSTESEEIAQTSRNWGADVSFLRERFYDDTTPVSSVTVNVLQELKKRQGKEFNVVVQLMANCPLRKSRDIVESFNSFINSGAQFQISCSQFGWQNPWWAMECDFNGVPTPLFPSALKSRSQDLPSLFCPSGAIWIADVGALFREETFYADGFRLHPIHWQAAIDIDDLEDFDLANAVFSKVIRNSKEAR